MELRIADYHKSFPTGNAHWYENWEKKQWKLAELKILSP